jgi:putative addiction module component (TIGR02574 family)
MHVNIDSLGISRLSVGERLELIEQIWDSLPEQVEPDDVPPHHLAELAKRRANVDKEPRRGKPWRAALDSLEGDV